MKMINQMKLVFDSRSSNESFARTAITGFIASLDPTIEELTDIKTAISEAVTNCIVHAYGETINKIYISAAIYDNNFIVIKVKDKGCGIDNIEQAMEPMFTTKASQERSGLGFAIMQAMTDHIKVSSSPKGTMVTLKKKIKSKE